MVPEGASKDDGPAKVMCGLWRWEVRKSELWSYGPGVAAPGGTCILRFDQQCSCSACAGSNPWLSAGSTRDAIRSLNGVSQAIYINTSSLQSNVLPRSTQSITIPHRLHLYELMPTWLACSSRCPHPAFRRQSPPTVTPAGSCDSSSSHRADPPLAFHLLHT